MGIKLNVDEMKNINENDKIYDDFYWPEKFLSGVIVDEIVEDSANKNIDELWMEILKKILSWYDKQRGKNYM